MDHNDWIAALPGIAALVAVIVTYFRNKSDAKNAAKKLADEKVLLTEQAEKIDQEREKVRAEKNKVQVEAAAIIQKAAFDLNEQYKKRMEELERDSNLRMRSLEKSSNQLKNHVIKLENQLREVLTCLVDTVEGANKLFDQVVKKHKDKPEYTPPSIDAIKGRKESILKHIDKAETA